MFVIDMNIFELKRPKKYQSMCIHIFQIFNYYFIKSKDGEVWNFSYSNE